MGNHGENGKIALLVMNETTNKPDDTKTTPKLELLDKLKLKYNIKTIATIKKTIPNTIHHYSQ